MPATRSTDEIQSIVSVVLKQILMDKNFIKTIADTVSAEITSSINHKLKELDKELMEIKNDLTWMKNVVAEFKTNTEVQINNLQESTLHSNCIDKIDNLEQESKMNNLRIFRVPEKNNENTKTEIINVLKTKLKIEITENDIETCYRIGKYMERRTRGIFLKLTTLKIKQKIFKSKKEFKGSGICVKEDLTAKRLEIINEAIKKYSLENVWTESGRIFAKINSKIVNITSKDQMND